MSTAIEVLRKRGINVIEIDNKNFSDYLSEDKEDSFRYYHVFITNEQAAQYVFLGLLHTLWTVLELKELPGKYIGIYRIPKSKIAVSYATTIALPCTKFFEIKYDNELCPFDYLDVKKCYCKKHNWNLSDMPSPFNTPKLFLYDL